MFTEVDLEEFIKKCLLKHRELQSKKRISVQEEILFDVLHNEFIQVVHKVMVQTITENLSASDVLTLQDVEDIQERFGELSLIRDKEIKKELCRWVYERKKEFAEEYIKKHGLLNVFNEIDFDEFYYRFEKELAENEAVNLFRLMHLLKKTEEEKELIEKARLKLKQKKIFFSESHCCSTITFRYT